MDFDLVLEEIGEFGWYQQKNYILLCLPVFFAAANSLTYVFTAGIPKYRCYIPGCDDPLYPIYNEHWVQNAVPGTNDRHDVFEPEQCEMFNKLENITKTIPKYQRILDDCSADMFSDKTEKCAKWVFDKNERTIVNDWEITCADNQWMLALVGTAHFAGIVFGSGIFGILADSFGRKPVFVFCIFFMSITGIGQALSKNYITFLIFAFLNAVGTSGVYPLAFILGVEMVGRRKREMSGIVFNYFYALGEAAVGLTAWLYNDWVILQFAASVPPILFVLIYWLIPESVRWLLAKKDTDKAEKIIKKAAKVNGVVLSESLLKKFELKSNLNDKESAALKTVPSINKIQKKNEIFTTLKHFIKSKTLIIRCLILFYIWATNAFVYYGLSLNSTNLSGNKYLNFILVCLVEIPGYSLAWIAMNKIGRRWSLAGSLLICAVTCVTGSFISEGYTWLVITLFLFGKMGITSSFAVIYVHTAEMLPTIIRSGGVGTMSTVARIGALIAPFVPLLRRYYKPLPLLLFGLVSVIGGTLALFLPETLGEKLPETVKDAENIGSKKRDDITNTHNENTSL